MNEQGHILQQDEPTEIYLVAYNNQVRNHIPFLINQHPNIYMHYFRKFMTRRCINSRLRTNVLVLDLVE